MALPRRNPQGSNPPNGRPSHEGTGGQSGNHQDNSRVTNRPLPTESDGTDLVQRPKPKA